MRDEEFFEWISNPVKIKKMIPNPSTIIRLIMKNICSITYHATTFKNVLPATTLLSDLVKGNAQSLLTISQDTIIEKLKVLSDSEFTKIIDATIKITKILEIDGPINWFDIKWRDCNHTDANRAKFIKAIIDTICLADISIVMKNQQTDTSYISLRYELIDCSQYEETIFNYQKSINDFISCTNNTEKQLFKYNNAEREILYISASEIIDDPSILLDTTETSDENHSSNDFETCNDKSNDNITFLSFKKSKAAQTISRLLGLSFDFCLLSLFHTLH
jgi:hypothetical protein